MHKRIAYLNEPGFEIVVYNNVVTIALKTMAVVGNNTLKPQQPNIIKGLRATFRDLSTCATVEIVKKIPNLAPPLVRMRPSYRTFDEMRQMCHIFFVMCPYGPINVLYIQDYLRFCLSIHNHRIICFYRILSICAPKQFYCL